MLRVVSGVDLTQLAKYSIVEDSDTFVIFQAEKGIIFNHSGTVNTGECAVHEDAPEGQGIASENHLLQLDIKQSSLQVSILMLCEILNFT